MLFLFKGTFNWYCELHVLYTHARSERKAFNNFISQLTKTLKVSRRSIYIYFVNGKKDNYKIKEMISNAKKDYSKETLSSS